MKKKKIAIVGGGVVGASAAYLLSKEPTLEVTLYDAGVGQGTSAAAGIISPWLSKRRNKKWYRMVKEGAAFYPKFLSEVMDGSDIPKTVYNQVGTLLFKNNPEHLEDLLKIGMKRREDAPEIGELKILSPAEIKRKVPLYTGNDSALWASGGARVDGRYLVDLLIQKAINQGAQFIKDHVETLTINGHYPVLKTTQYKAQFDTVVLAVAAWLPNLLEPLDYKVDIRPQKGQLLEIELNNTATTDWPVIMPEGETDIIPFDNGRIIIGATHENDKGFDLEIDKKQLSHMLQDATTSFSDGFRKAAVVDYRSGTRAYTSDFAPFFGPVPNLLNVYAASGLGSTGLTAGPLVGKELAQLVLKKPTSLPLEDYPIENYIQSIK